MKISVLIHNLNRATAVERCLASVANLGYRPLEVVIVDAGSTDNSLEIIQRARHDMDCRGIEVKVVSCPQMGVAGSRNFAAGHSSGDFLCFIDNDAAFVSSDCLSHVFELFARNERLAIVAFRVLDRDTERVDAVTWAFRRSREVWSHREFKTSAFVGTAFCIRRSAFWETGGFWDHLQYSREEEDLGLALVDRGWELLYSPAAVIRHYPEPNGRMSLAERRFGELCNGILVLWRRVPIPFALLAIGLRICSMALKTRRERNSVRALIAAVPKAAKEWRRFHLRRSPVSFKSAWRYSALHLPSKYT